MAVVITGLSFGAGMLWQQEQHRQVVEPWSFKKEIPKNDVLKVGVITDTHVDTKRNVYDGVRTDDLTDVYLIEKDERPIEKFISHVQNYNPNFVVHLGDVIDAPKQVTQEIGIAELGLVKTFFDQLTMPVHWVIGNHDLRGVSRDDFVTTLGADDVNYVLDQGEYYRFIFVDSNFNESGIAHTPMNGDYTPGHIPAVTVAWLEKQLQTDRHVYIFMHHSMIPKTLSGGKDSILNRNQVHGLLSRYNVKAVFSGHIEHRIAHEEDGVTYYTLPGTRKPEVFLDSYYDFNFIGGELEMQMYYMDRNTGEEFAEPFITEGKMFPQ